MPSAACYLPAEEIDESETAPPSLSRADALTVDGDETTVSTEPLRMMPSSVGFKTVRPGV